MPALPRPIPASAEAARQMGCPADTGSRRLTAALCVKYVSKFAAWECPLSVYPGCSLQLSRTARTTAGVSRADVSDPEPVLAAYLSAHRTMINGSALCAALAVTERD